MAIQVIAIQVLDPMNPKELQVWFTNNPAITVTSVVLYCNSFIVIYF